MFFHHAYAAILLLLLSFIQFYPCHQTPTTRRVRLQAIDKAIVSNIRQFFSETKQSRNSQVQQMRNEMLQVILHKHGMQETIGQKVSNRLLAEHLHVRKKAVAKYRKNTAPFRKMQPPKKKSGLTKKSFIYQHNQLCHTIVKFWLDNSVPSPNKKDVKWRHSSKPGEHVRVYNADRSAYTIQCTTQKCNKDQRRCVGLL